MNDPYVAKRKRKAARDIPGSPFGERLLEALDRRGLTKYGLEQKTGISDGYIGRLIRGERQSPRSKTVGQICWALGIRREWLVHGDGSMDPARGSAYPKGVITQWDAALAVLGGKASPDGIAAVEAWHRTHRDVEPTAEEILELIREVCVALLRSHRFDIELDDDTGRPVVVVRMPVEVVRREVDVEAS